MPRYHAIFPRRHWLVTLQEGTVGRTGPKTLPVTATKLFFSERSARYHSYLLESTPRTTPARRISVSRLP